MKNKEDETPYEDRRGRKAPSINILLLFLVLGMAIYLIAQTPSKQDSSRTYQDSIPSQRFEDVERLEERNNPARMTKEDKYIKTIDISDKSLAFSKVAKVGKVSLFIISAHWCKPCKLLKQSIELEFESGNLDPRYVDVYYCLVTKDNSEGTEELSNRQAYRHLRDIDGLVKVYPTTYILAPTTNCFAWVEGASQSKQNEIIEYARKLSNLAKNEFDPKYLSTELK